MPCRVPMLVTLSALLLTTAAGCSSGSSSSTSDPDAGVLPPCPATYVRVVSCGGDQVVCVQKPSSNCTTFNGAQPASDNPCNFGNRYSAQCVSVDPGTPPTVRCACS